MTPKEKCDELVFKYILLIGSEHGLVAAQECVNQIIESTSDWAYSNNTWDKYDNDNGHGMGSYQDASEFWNSVKEEIEKL